MPFAFSSALTFSKPILSNLSMATVMSTILSASPIISAMPVKIFLLLIFIATRIPNLENKRLDMMGINN